MREDLKHLKLRNPSNNATYDAGENEIGCFFYNVRQMEKSNLKRMTDLRPSFELFSLNEGDLVFLCIVPGPHVNESEL